MADLQKKQQQKEQEDSSSPSYYSSLYKPLFNRSFTYNSNHHHSSASSPNPDNKSNLFNSKPQSQSIWSQTAKRFSNAFRRSQRLIPPPPPPPAADTDTRDDKIVIYFTSLHGIRRTYEDCVAVRSIFRCFMVPVDERDVSMDSAYRRELQSLLAPSSPLTLPAVFVRGRYIGGADDIRQLLETGELRKILQGFPPRDPSDICHACGDARFLPCRKCSGSRKVFAEDERKLKRCLDCNENGLVRCCFCNSS